MYSHGGEEYLFGVEREFDSYSRHGVEVYPISLFLKLEVGVYNAYACFEVGTDILRRDLVEIIEGEDVGRGDDAPVRLESGPEAVFDFKTERGRRGVMPYFFIIDESESENLGKAEVAGRSVRIPHDSPQPIMVGDGVGTGFVSQRFYSGYQD